MLVHFPKIINDGLVLCLDAFNPNSYSEGINWIDLSNNNNNGTLVDSPSWTSFGGGSFLFNGSSNFISTPLNIDANNNTLCSWFNPNSSSNIVRSVITSDDGDYDKGFGQRGLNFSINLGDSEIYVGSLVLNNWYFCTLTYSATNMEFFVNGISIYNSGFSQGPTFGSSVSIGNATYPNDGIGSRFFSGYISFCSVYNRVLSQTEIIQNYNALKGRYGLL